jgi:hypothetical protein
VLFSLCDIIHAVPASAMGSDELNAVSPAIEPENTSSIIQDNDNSEPPPMSSLRRKLEEGNGAQEPRRKAQKRDMGRNEYL